MSNPRPTEPPRFLAYHCGRLRGLCVEDYRAFDLTTIPWDDLRGRPSDPNHHLAKASRTRCVVRMEYAPEGRPPRMVFAKRVLVRDLRKRIGSLFTASKARHEWQAGHRLLAMGIATARPVVCAELRTGPWHYANFLVTEELQGARPLADFLATQRTGDERRTLLARLAHWLWHVHCRGFYHDDCSAQHVFIVPAGRAGGKEPSLAFIDLDNGRFYRATVPWPRRVKNLFQLLRSLPLPSASPTLREQFLRAYLECSGETNQWERVVGLIRRLARAKNANVFLESV